MRGRGSGKRLVSLFLGCALIVVGLIGPQVVGRADGEITIKNGAFSPDTAVYGVVTSIGYDGKLTGVDTYPVSGAGYTYTATLKKDDSNKITPTVSYDEGGKTVYFTTSTTNTLLPGDYGLTFSVPMQSGSFLSVNGGTFKILAPTIQDPSVSPNTGVTTGGSISFSVGKVLNVSGGSIAGVTALFKDSSSNIITSEAFEVKEGESVNKSIDIPNNAVPGEYEFFKLTGSSIFDYLEISGTRPKFTVINNATIPAWSGAKLDKTTDVATGDTLTFKGDVTNTPGSISSVSVIFTQEEDSTQTVDVSTWTDINDLTGTISVPNAPGKTYKLTSMMINGATVAGTVPTLSFKIKDNTPTTPTLSNVEITPNLFTRSTSPQTGQFNGKVYNISAPVSSSAIFTNASNDTVSISAFTVKNNELFHESFSITNTTPKGTYYLTTMPGITGLVIPKNTYGFTVTDASDPYVSDVTIANETESGKEVIFTANLKNVPTSTDIGGYFTFKNKSDSTDIVTAGFSATNKSTTDSALLVTNIRTAFSNTSGSDKIYFVSDVTGTKNLNNLTLGTGAHKEIKVKSSSTPTNPTLTDINLTSEVLPNGIVYFSGKVSPKPTGDTISASFVPEAIGGTEIPFSTGISSDGTFSGQIPVGNVAVGSIYKLSGVKVGTSYITWDGQYMFRVVSSVSTPTLSTLAIGNPYTTSGTTTIPLSATITSAGTTGGVANIIKYIEIDYAIDTTTPAKATLYSSSSNLFTGNVARQFTNGSSHTITLSRARIYYQAGSDTSGNKVKEYDSLTGLIANNPVRFTVNNYNPSPVNPVNPVNPSNPSTPTGSTAVNQRAANTIIAMANNGSATLDYTSSPTVSANIFDLLRGTQKTVNLLAPGGFIWTFNGATVTGASKQIDLRVTATTLAATGASNSFPLVASLTGNRPVVILNFANNGVLPGTATITIPMSQHTSYIGTSNIYQYFVNESTRRLEKIGGPVTVSSGNTVTMAINHDSTYILTYGEVAGATAPTTPTNNTSDVLPIYNANATPTINTPTNTTPTGGTTINTVYRPGSTSPKTGDAFRMYVWVGMLLIGAFLVFASVLWPKKKEKSA